MTIKHLVTAGCSMTFGTEILNHEDHVIKADPNLNKIRRERAWPHILATALDLTNDNLGTGGASNWQIAENVMKWFRDECIVGSRDPSELFFVVQWSGINRWPLPWGNTWHSVIPGSENFGERPKELRRVWAQYLEHFHDPYYNHYQFYQLVLTLQEWFKFHGVKYHMCNAFANPSIKPGVLADHDNFTAAPAIMNAIDKETYPHMFAEGESMNGWLRRSGYKDFAPGKHPRAGGHILWAYRLVELIEGRLQ